MPYACKLYSRRTIWSGTGTVLELNVIRQDCNVNAAGIPTFYIISKLIHRFLSVISFLVFIEQPIKLALRNPFSK